jgi:hypothetical protein
MVAAYAFQRLFDLVALRFGFLQQYAVGIEPHKRIGKTFVLYRANAVDIPGNYFH